MEFEENLRCFQNHPERLLKYQIGLEREVLRTGRDGFLSLKPHPLSLGSSLTHPYISTDFSESQLECITPPFESIESVIAYTKNLQKFIYSSLDDDILWPFSMPCILPCDNDIPIAKYGSSDTARQKEVYRKGLVYRYGIAMQLISGIHANFSFSHELLKTLYDKKNRGESFQTFKNDSYFNVIQNFLYEGWILSYLFGASTCCHESYKPYLPVQDYQYITSLRMSSAGYFNKTECQSNISFCDLDSYIQDLSHAINTPCHKFSEIGLIKNGERIQLNDNHLQIENEHYTRIRPKPICSSFLRPLEALKTFGVEYLEIRSLDIDPFSPIGTSEKQLYFLYLFLLYALLKPSEIKETKKHSKLLLCNQNAVALKGRDPDLLLKTLNGDIKLQTWGIKILCEMEKIAKMLNKTENGLNFNTLLEEEKQKFYDPSLTLSGRLQKEFEKHEFIKYGIGLSLSHKKNLLATPLTSKQQSSFTKLTEKSFKDLKNLEDKEYFQLKDYEDLEQSTQILLRESFNQGLTFEIINREDHLIKIYNKNKTAYVKQATITEKDSYLTYHLLKNKENTKHFLKQAGLKTPQNIVLTQKEDLNFAINELHTNLVVIRPSRANFGHGISFVDKFDQKALKKSLNIAFSYDSQVLVEEFVEGSEYRFLVIDGKVVAILQRVPANVVGDGKSSITQLIKEKNTNPRSYKTSKDAIRLTTVEKEFLKEQSLTPSSVLKKGQQIFLRRNSNISTGGDSIDATDGPAQKFSSIAIKATQTIGASICGIDMIIPNLNQDDYSILEMNYNPNIAMHYYPYQGKSRNAAKELLKFLGF